MLLKAVNILLFHPSSYLTSGVLFSPLLVTPQYPCHLAAHRFTLACLQSQHSKVHRHTIAPLSILASHNNRFDHIHILSDPSHLQRIHIPAHLCWLIHPLAEAIPSQLSQLRPLPEPSSLVGLLAFVLLFNHLHRHRMPVWLWTLHSPHAAPRYQGHLHDHQPPLSPMDW